MGGVHLTKLVRGHLCLFIYFCLAFVLLMFMCCRLLLFFVIIFKPFSLTSVQLVEKLVAMVFCWCDRVECLCNKKEVST